MPIKPIILAFATLLPAAAAAENPPAPQKEAGCTSPESRQFDFWVGNWDVYPKSHPGRKVANSLIEKLYAGCGIRENRMARAGGGKSWQKSFDLIYRKTAE